MPNSTDSQDLRLLLPEKVWLENEDFELAKQTSLPLTSSNPKASWQVYLNTLALLGLETWLQDNLQSEQVITREMGAIATAGIVQVGEYKFCAIATEHVLDEIVNIPDTIIDRPFAHFYILMEVLEEEEEVVLRGFLPYPRLLEIKNNFQLPVRENSYQFSLDDFDWEPNHLLTYQRYIPAFEFALPVLENQIAQPVEIDENLAQTIQSTTTKLSQWLQGVMNRGWETIDSLTSPELSLAFATRNAEQTSKGAKILDLGINLDNEKVVLLLNLSPEISSSDGENQSQTKINVLVQLFPTSGNRFLPQSIKLILLSKAGKTLQEVTARVHDNYIQLKPFKGEIGKKFSIQVSLGNVNFTEDFEL